VRIRPTHSATVAFSWQEDKDGTKQTNTINFEKSEVFLHKKFGRPHLKKENPFSPCSKNVRTGQNPSPTDSGLLLWA